MDGWVEKTKAIRGFSSPKYSQRQHFLTTFPDILFPTHAHFFISSSYMNHVKHDVTTLNVAPILFFFLHEITYHDFHFYRKFKKKKKKRIA